MKFIPIISALIILSIFSSIISAPTTSSFKNTNWSITDNGNIIYLDRQHPKCPNDSVMSYFFLARNQKNNDHVRYEFSCLKSDSVSGEPSTEQTKNNAIDSNHRYSVNYLDRHDVRCPEGTLLNGFHVVRNFKKQQLRYVYSCLQTQTLCCKTFTTTKNAMGGREIFYLDRHAVGKKNSLKWGIQQFKLNAQYHGGEKIWYSYRMCQLKDLEAQKAADEAAIKLEQSRVMYQQAVSEYTIKLKMVKELEDKVASTNLNLVSLQSDEAEKNKSNC